ncbi:monovalent cation/H(+) antiporter subunit G [Oceanobacillus kimchii]|uniref:Na(+)/H(+) antiporter subunit G1 n=1 Tax=Oceanobacillus kimchii TaxID=746691 RepID=A0ABQ5TNG6_9BACI|nr:MULTISPECIES: monovalent cation/H(+) antiporter subunit G [Oceanobacillus]MBT2598249.1 Na+/H+ antiporter subunit G [Oceanobacillus sp. ISL-74]MBT2651168.1 Na+/H+ antiporter subunit G [Oceanobacillus sp. ISL-73]MCT1575827.1 monovalent cation/H(+) antiporter subunit G [Oceanobacillus kimchii]MCT2135464.1 monovalent cation/H(+) antiporter subunit G [Oceanobacillus kimchii]OEH55571.1 cation:proton antiporter [Oceanobacillus sp. E9]
MNVVIDTIVILLVIIGLFFTVVSAIGVLRLPDVYSRAHAAGKSATLGVMSIMLAVFIHFLSHGTMNAKILLAIIFLFMTAPLASLMITRSAYRTGVKLSDNTTINDLADMYKEETKESN